MAYTVPEWIKPGIIGGIIGAIAITIVGFGTDTVVSSGEAQEMAENSGEKAAILALTPICVAQFKAEPQGIKTAQLIALEDESSYKRDDYVAKQGWATMPGSTEPNREIANTCADQLMKIAES